MLKFQGLEQLNLNVWEFISKLPKPLVINFIQYICSISKYVLRQYIKDSDKNKIIGMVATFMENATTNNANTPILLNARLRLESYKDAQFSRSRFMEINKLKSCFVEFSSQGSLYNVNGEKKWCGSDQNKNGKPVVDLDVRYTFGDEFSQPRDANMDNFVGDFMYVYGSELHQLCFSARSRLGEDPFLYWNKKCEQCLYPI